MLIGGSGLDILTGGLGADAFVFENLDDSTIAASDVITDFGMGGGDKINLTNLDGASFDLLSFTHVGDDMRVSMDGSDFAFVLQDTSQALVIDDFIFA